MDGYPGREDGTRYRESGLVLVKPADIQVYPVRSRKIISN